MVASRSGPDPTRTPMKGDLWDPEFRVYYPDGDDEPLADNETNGAEMVRITETLGDHFSGRPDVYVWMDLFVYYEQGNPKEVVAPDVFVAMGAGKEPERRSYQIWNEAVPPTVVFELTSDATHRRDMEDKQEIYARMGVPEYFLYDPDGDYVRERLRGYRLAGGVYEPLALEPGGRLRSERLGLHLGLVENRLQFFEIPSDRRLLSPRERAVAEAARADAEHARAALEAARADSEKTRADAAERRIAALLEQLAQREDGDQDGDQHGGRI